MDHTPFEYGGLHFIPERRFEPAGQGRSIIPLSRMREDQNLMFPNPGEFAYPTMDFTKRPPTRTAASSAARRTGGCTSPARTACGSMRNTPTGRGGGNMGGNEEKRMAGDYVITHALKIGDREIVLGEDPNGVGDERYMCAFCETNSLFASYTEVMVSKDYPELVKLFGERVAEQAEKTRIALNGPKLQGIPNAPITSEGCEVIGWQHDLRGKVIVIKPEVLRPEYRRATCQLQLCTGGFGASPEQPRLRLLLYGVVLRQDFPF